MRYIYSFIFSVALPLIFIKLWLRGKKLPAYRRRWRERLGFFNQPTFPVNNKVIWIHAVSVGEFIAAKPLIQHYLNQPDMTVVVTTMTPTGSEQVINTFGKKVCHIYAPYDLTHIINRFIRKIRPDVYVVMETELWPNTIHCCKKNNIPVIIANARLSEKSARGYARLANFSSHMLKNISTVAVQNATDAERFLSLGLPNNNLVITGSIKFDLDLQEHILLAAHTLKDQINPQQKHVIWIAASTHRGEDEIILQAFAQVKQSQPLCRLILVPRHPDRFNEVYDLCLRKPFTTIKRSQQLQAKLAQPTAIQPNNNFDILLGDTMGELLTLFGCADFTFMGGSFVNTGGHNSIEAAAWGLPIISGPSTFNFHEITQLLVNESALTIVNDANQLARKVTQLCSDTCLRENEGRAAKKVAEENRGALVKLIKLIDKHLHINK